MYAACLHILLKLFTICTKRASITRVGDEKYLYLNLFSEKHVETCYASEYIFEGFLNFKLNFFF